MSWRKHKVLTTLGTLVLGSALAWGLYRLYDPSGSDINDMTWTERVQLASGKTVSIERHVRFQEYSVFGTGGSSSGPVDEWDTISIPDDPTFVLWAAPIRPMFLDRDPDTDEWIIVAADEQGGAGNLWGNNGIPCPPQWAFRLREGRWYIQSVPVNVIARLPNLLVDLRVSDDARLLRKSFAAEVAARKRAQAQDGRGVPGNMRSVGVVGEGYQRTCKDVSAPAFMGPFRSAYGPGMRSLRDMEIFPKLTE